MIDSGISLSEIVRAFALPPASLFLLVALGWLLQIQGVRRGRYITIGSLLVLYFLCSGIGSYLLVYPLERLVTPLQQTTNTGAQAIVVLAAGRLASAPEYGNEEIPDYVALARLRYAAKLYHETGLPVLVSGSNASVADGLKPKAIAMASALRNEFRVPVRWIEQESENTEENAKFSSRMLKQSNVHRILLVTDAMHMPRSVKLFEAAGMEVVPAPTMFFSAHQLTISHVLPTAENLWRSYYAIYQWLAMARDMMRY